MPATTAHCLNDYLTGELRVGEADVHGPLAVFPLFGPIPELESSWRYPPQTRHFAHIFARVNSPLP